MTLLQKLLKAGSTTGASVLADSSIFAEKNPVKTQLPVLNIAFSGEIDGGLVAGLTIFAGESKTFKSALSLYCMKAYLDKFDDAVAVFYDTEFGVTKSYLETFGIDANRVIHIPIEHVEQLKFDMVKKLDEIKKGDRVFFLVDSIGQISSKKEVEDAVDEKSVADMSRAKAIRSLMRLITIQLAKKELPCIMINHVYKTMELYSKTVIPGGTSVTYSANQIFVISKSQEKSNDGDLKGWNFTLNVEKSRFVKEKSKLQIQVLYNKGIQKYSGILELALEGKFVQKPKNGWYQLADTETGELVGKLYREADTASDEFLGQVIKNDNFKKFVTQKFCLSANEISDSDIDNAIEDLE
jgi:RecA/RadA recombinase